MSSLAPARVKIRSVKPTRAKLAALEETRVVDGHTFVCKLRNPTLVFLNNISQTEWGYAGIPHARHVAKHGKDYGVVPGSVIRLRQKRPSFVIEIEGTSLALDGEVAREIFVRRES